jgi:cyclopropane fatty-acyl-phospholipid synthase-like methyltransferase
MRKATPSFTHRRLIINFLNSRNICTVLDYGSGIGLLTTELNKYRFDVFFTDIEGIQTEFLKYFLNKANLKAYYIPLNKINEFKGFFDAVVCLEVLEHSMDFYETLSNIVNLSRKIIILSYTFGGRFQEPGHINKGVKLGKIVSDYLKNYGFNKVELKIWNNRVKFYEKK